MIITIGEVVTDHFPKYRRIGGAPLNFACHLQKFRENVVLITRLGNDADGDEIRSLIRDHGLPSAFIQRDRHHSTGRVHVTLDAQGGPNFDIVIGTAYDHIELDPSVFSRLAGEQTLIYYGSLIQRSTNGFTQLRRFLESRPKSAKCFCDINLRPPHFRHEVIEQCLHYADILKLNEEELMTIAAMLTVSGTAPDMVAALMDRYRLEMVAVTLGAGGSFVVHANQRYDAPRPKTEDLVDTVGAGDAFAAVLALGYLRQLPLNLVLKVATGFAAEVCRRPGAIPADDAPYERVERQLKDSQR
ncbi:MAG: PfkB family carbohydrate kinase [Thermodesulfobacteriota bacterium]